MFMHYHSNFPDIILERKWSAQPTLPDGLILKSWTGQHTRVTLGLGWGCQGEQVYLKNLINGQCSQNEV